MTVFRTLRLPLLAALLLALVQPALSAEERAKPKIKISKETTFITEPLREDGTVDYLAAINQRCSNGITSENNAAIPFWHAVGAKRIDPKVRKQYFELLGIAEPPENGEYLESLSDFLTARSVDGKQRSDAYEQFEQSRERPWTKKQFPVIADLLERNKKPLQAVMAAVERPRFYSPIVAEDGKSLVHMTFCVGLSEAREASWQLMALAMLRLGHRDFDGAWQAILAEYHLARIQSQGPLLVDRMIARMYENNAYTAAVVLSQCEGLTAAKASDFESRLRKLPPMSPAADLLNVSERLYALDSILDMAVNKKDAVNFKYSETFSSLSNDEQKEQDRALAKLVTEKQVDWNEVLRLENMWYDRFVAAAACPAVAKRLEMIASLKKDDATAARQAARRVLYGNGEPPNMDVPTVNSKRLVAISHGPGPLDSAPAFALTCDERAATRRELGILALALAAYRSEMGDYPKTLTALTPKYLVEVPKDAIHAADLHYESDGKGYVLYSAGVNGKGEHGRNYLEESRSRGFDSAADEAATDEEKSADDIAIRTPGYVGGER